MFFRNPQKICDFFALGQEHTVIVGNHPQTDHHNNIHGYSHKNRQRAAQQATACHGANEPGAQERGAAHDGSGQSGLCHISYDAWGGANYLAHGKDVQNGDRQITAQRSYGSALDVNGRIADQDVIDNNLNDAANEHIHYRQIHIAVGLHERIGQQYRAVEDDANAQNPQQIGGSGQRLSGIAPEQSHDRSCQYTQTHRAGHCNQTHDPDGGFFQLLSLTVLFQGKLRGHSRQNADCDGCDESAGEIENGLGKVINTFEAVGLILGKACRTNELGHNHLGVNESDDLQSGGADGNGDGDGQQLFCGNTVGVHRAAGEGLFLPGATVAAIHIDQGDQRANGDAQNGTACGQRGILRRLHDDKGQTQTYHQLTGRFQDLTDGGGTHVALALEETPESRGLTHDQSGGTQAGDGCPGVGRIHKVGQRLAEAGHQNGACHTQSKENTPGGLIGSVNLAVVSQAACLSDHPAHGYGKTGGGDHQKDTVDVVSRGEVTKAGITDDASKGNLIQRANDLDNGHRRCQQGSAVEKGLLFVGCQRKPFFLTIQWERTAGLWHGWTSPAPHYAGQWFRTCRLRRGFYPLPWSVPHQIRWRCKQGC